MCTRVSSSYLNLTGRRGSLCGECEPPPRQGSSARTAHSRTAGAREPVKLWGREGAGATRAAPTALALPWNPSKTSPRKSLCGARQRRRKIHSPDEAMKRCISWCVSPPLECPLLASRARRAGLRAPPFGSRGMPRAPDPGAKTNLPARRGRSCGPMGRSGPDYGDRLLTPPFPTASPLSNPPALGLGVCLTHGWGHSHETRELAGRGSRRRGNSVH